MKDESLLEMRVFKAVVEDGGFTAAANMLGVSQPFVSQSINGLERRLTVPIFRLIAPSRSGCAAQSGLDVNRSCTPGAAR
jgi:DNA-binding transcriptional LysR family regulator